LALKFNPFTGTLDIVEAGGGGGSGANTALSNLAATAVNTSILPDANTGRELGSESLAWHQMFMKIGNLIDTSNVNTLDIRGQVINGADGNTGPGLVTVGPGAAAHNLILTTSGKSALNTGLVSITSGNQFGAFDSGLINIETGENTSSGNTGDIQLKVGAVNTGTQGDIKFLKDGVPSVIGQVWTATGVNGEGYWAAGGGGGATTALDNLASTAVNVDILPVDGNKSLGNVSTLPWNNVNAKQVNSIDPTGFINGSLSSFVSSMPSGNTIDVGLFSQTTRSLGIYSLNNANLTGNVYIETGNNTSGANVTGDIGIKTGNGPAVTGSIDVITGNAGGAADSGPITLQTGTVSSGTRGDIQLDGNIVDASNSDGPFRSPNLTADPASPANGDIWYNTTSNQLKCRANGVTVVLA